MCFISSVLMEYLNYDLMVTSRDMAVFNDVYVDSSNIVSPMSSLYGGPWPVSMYSIIISSCSSLSSATYYEK